jgi:hypothetical protein
MPRPSDPWERAMMREYKIEDVAELRKILAQPPSPKYNRSDEIQAGQLEFERFAKNYERKRNMDFIRRAPIVAKFTLYFSFRGKYGRG